MRVFRYTIAALLAAALAGCGGNGFGGLFGGKDKGSGSAGSGSTKASQQAMDPQLVRQVQQALKERDIDAGPVDGVWGEQTQQAVREFQKKQGLEATGQLDRKTLSALGVKGEGGSAAAGGSSGTQPPTRQQQEKQKQ